MLAFTMAGILMLAFAVGLHLGSERYEEENELLREEGELAAAAGIEPLQEEEERFPSRSSDTLSSGRPSARQTASAAKPSQPPSNLLRGKQGKQEKQGNREKERSLAGSARQASRPASQSARSTQSTRSAQAVRSAQATGSSRSKQAQGRSAVRGDSTALLASRKSSPLKLSNVNLSEEAARPTGSAKKGEGQRAGRSAPSASSASSANSASASSAGRAKSSRAAPTSAYLLQAGAFRSRAGARKLATELRQKGFKPLLRQDSDYYYVQLGEPGSPDRNRNIEERLKAANYSFIRIKR